MTKHAFVLLVPLLCAAVACDVQISDQTEYKAKYERLAQDKRNEDETLKQKNAALRDIEDAVNILAGSTVVIMDTTQSLEFGGLPPERRDVILGQLNVVKDRLRDLARDTQRSDQRVAQQAQVIEYLRRLATERLVTIARLEEKLTTTSSALTTVQAEKGHLVAQLEDLRRERAELNNDLANERAARNQVWFAVGTERDLRAAGILTTTGRWFKKRVAIGPGDVHERFTRGDKSLLRSIPLGDHVSERNVTILTGQDKADQTLCAIDTRADGATVLTIRDKERFWQTNLLIVQVTR